MSNIINIRHLLSGLILTTGYVVPFFFEQWEFKYDFFRLCICSGIPLIFWPTKKESLQYYKYAIVFFFSGLGIVFACDIVNDDIIRTYKWIFVLIIPTYICLILMFYQWLRRLLQG